MAAITVKATARHFVEALGLAEDRAHPTSSGVEYQSPAWNSHAYPPPIVH